MPSESELGEMHAGMLLLLQAFHKLCMENDIRYSLHAGTLLGAVREKGFIPWDDDIDVMLMREEYDKLLKILDSRGKEYGVSFQRVKKAPCLIPAWKTDLPIWLDLFVYDSISERQLAQKCKFGLLMFLTATLYNRKTITATRAPEYSKIKQIAFYIACYLGLPFPFKQKARLFDWASQNAFCGNKTIIHRSNDMYSNMRLVYPNSIMDEYIFTEFEGTELMITKRYHEVLTSLYGEDYMIPKRMTTTHTNAHAAVRKLCSDLKP